MITKERHKIIPDAQLILVRNEGKEILLQKRAGDFYHGWYGLISGHIDTGELPSQTIAREALEEAGIVVKVDDSVPVHVLYRKTVVQKGERVTVFFATQAWQGEPVICEQNKCLSFDWFSIDQLPQNIIPHIRYALNEILVKGTCYSEFVDQEEGMNTAFVE